MSKWKFSRFRLICPVTSFIPFQDYRSFKRSTATTLFNPDNCSWTWNSMNLRYFYSSDFIPCLISHSLQLSISNRLNEPFFFFKLSVSTRTCPQLPQLSLLPLGPTDFTLRANNVEPPIAHTVPLSWEDASNKNHFIVSHLGLLTAEYSRPGTKPHSHLQCLLQGKDKLL